MKAKLLLLLSLSTVLCLLMACGQFHSARNLFGKLSEEGKLNGISYEIRRGDYYKSEYSVRGYTMEEASNGKCFYIICSGERPSGGYNLEITDIKANERNEWEVIVKEKEPGKGVSVTTALTYPNCILALSDEPSGITFKNTDGETFRMVSGT